MPVTIKELDGGKLLEVHAAGKLSKNDYLQFVPEVERRIKQNGKVNILFEMADFKGWDAGGLWQDIKFDLHHSGDIDRLAVVGGKKWEKWMSVFCRPFTRAAIRFFDPNHAHEARHWVEAPCG